MRQTQTGRGSDLQSGSRLRFCKRCSSTKSTGEFWNLKRGPDGLDYYCKECHRALNAHPDEDKYREYRRTEKRDLRDEVINAYGGKCSCCGETIPVFLTLDHTKGGGSKERKKHGGWKAYYDAKRRNFPPDYQVLCFNCNWGKHANGGVCPHKTNHD